MPLDKLASQLLSALQKYKVLAIAGVFLSFFVVITILNFFQKATLEGFVSLKKKEKELEKFTNCNAPANNNNVPNNDNDDDDELE